MPDNNIIGLTEYIARLCASHVEIQHKPEEPHFIELNDEKQLTSDKNQIYPLVALDLITIIYTGQNDSMNKSRLIDLLFLEKVPAGDFAAIQATKNKMEHIAEEFVIKMKKDSRDRKTYPFLKNLVMGSIEINTIEHKGINLHGAIMSCSYELPFVEYIAEGRFL